MAMYRREQEDISRKILRSYRDEARMHRRAVRIGPPSFLRRTGNDSFVVPRVGFDLGLIEADGVAVIEDGVVPVGRDELFKR